MIDISKVFGCWSAKKNMESINLWKAKTYTNLHMSRSPKEKILKLLGTSFLLDHWWRWGHIAPDMSGGNPWGHVDSNRGQGREGGFSHPPGGTTQGGTHFFGSQFWVKFDPNFFGAKRAKNAKPLPPAQDPQGPWSIPPPGGGGVQWAYLPPCPGVQYIWVIHIHISLNQYLIIYKNTCLQ